LGNPIKKEKRRYEERINAVSRVAYRMRVTVHCDENGGAEPGGQQIEDAADDGTGKVKPTYAGEQW